MNPKYAAFQVSTASGFATTTGGMRDGKTLGLQCKDHWSRVGAALILFGLRKVAFTDAYR